LSLSSNNKQEMVEIWNTHKPWEYWEQRSNYAYSLIYYKDGSFGSSGDIMNLSKSDNLGIKEYRKEEVQHTRTLPTKWVRWTVINRTCKRLINTLFRRYSDGWWTTRRGIANRCTAKVNPK
jgi:hypothetical protein